MAKRVLFHAGTGVSFRKLRFFMPFQAPDRCQIRRLRGIIYAEDFDSEITESEKDCYGRQNSIGKTIHPVSRRNDDAAHCRPANAVDKLPGVLWIHGGGYIIGMSSMLYFSRAIDLVRQGKAVAVSPEYRGVWDIFPV